MIVGCEGGGFCGGFRFHAMNGAHDRKGDRIEQCDVEWSDEQPCGHRVECAGSEFVEEARGIGLHQLAHLTNTEIDRWRAEKFFAETNAEVNDRNVERPAGLIDELRDRLIELQGERGQKAEQR